MSRVPRPGGRDRAARPLPPAHSPCQGPWGRRGGVPFCPAGATARERGGIGGPAPSLTRVPRPAPPQIAGPREPLTRVSVLQGGEAALDCNATGRPLPAVTWERDGQPLRTEPGLQLQSQGHRLRVQQAQAAHAGRYSCVAKNAVGLAERRFELSVLGEAGQHSGALLPGLELPEVRSCLPGLLRGCRPPLRRSLPPALLHLRSQGWAGFDPCGLWWEVRAG